MTTTGLAANHFTLTTASDVRQICNAFMRHFNLRYFDYGRIYHDGRATLLATDPDWVCHYFATQNPVGGEVRKNGIYPWPIHLPSQTIIDARNAFNIDNAVTEIIEHVEYTEFFDFAATAGDEKALYYQLNHYDLYSKFLSYFKLEAKTLIDKAFLHPVAEKVNAINNSFEQINVDKVLVDINHPFNTLSVRQKECVKLLVKGMSYKQIGYQLGLSMRTVEHYLETVRQKLGCDTRLQLIAYAQDIL